MQTLSRRLGPAVAALAVPLLLATCKGSSEPPKVPTTIVVSPPSTTFHSLGLTQQFTAAVKDQNGNALTSASVTWTSNNAAVTISTSGLATAAANGTAQVTATSGSATQSVTVTVGQVAVALVKVSGDSQTATVGQAAALPIVVQVNDSNAHPVAGASVSFAAAIGGGSVGTSTTTTDANGQAQSTWTLGQLPIVQTATAAAGSLPVLTFSVTANPGPAKTIAVQAGNNQLAASGHPVTNAPAVIVRDTFANAKPGVTVTFAPAAGSGSVTGGTQTTNAFGIAVVGSWMLGNLGKDTLVATATGTGIAGNPVKFIATSLTASGPAIVAAYVGDGQTGLVGNRTNVRPAVLVTDAGSNPVLGATVTFAVASGGGSLTGGVTTTNASGIAQVGNWTMGAAPATNTMTATVTGSGISGNPVTFTATGAAAVYTIQIQYYGPAPTTAEQAAFNAASAKWQNIVYQHPGPPVQVTAAAGACGAGEPAVNQQITDVLIFAKFDSIDGPGKVLGYSSPCFFRTNNGLTLTGIMVFDTADVATLIANSQLNEVILHEMGHVLGLGTLWNLSIAGGVNRSCLFLPSNPPGTINDTYFGCPKARAAFDSMGGTSYTGASLSPPGGNKVPVENCGASSPAGCGGGTVNGHWREPVFGNELMTGYINAGTNPLSVLSVAAQEDLGYVVNYAGADAYTHAFSAPVVGGAPPLFLGDDIFHGPRYAVDAAGRITKVSGP
jgi:hypothetical protein